MNIIFRVDASTSIGSGHIRRCLILASYLRKRGANVSFICREVIGNLCCLLEQSQFIVHRLPFDNAGTSESAPQQIQVGDDAIASAAIIDKHGPIDWLVIDHYCLDQKWERAVSQSVRNIFVIDDLANHPHSCNALLNHAYLTDLHKRYDGLVPPNTQLLLGPKHFILNPAFHNARNNAVPLISRNQRLLIFFGGADVTDETTKAIHALREITSFNIDVDVVITQQNKRRNSIKALVRNSKQHTLHEDLPDLSKLMAQATIILGAGGGTIYESLFMGLPSIVVTTAEHQTAAAKQLHQSKLIWWLGSSPSITVPVIRETIKTWVSKKSDKILVEPEKLMNVVDGKGLTRIEKVLENS